MAFDIQKLHAAAPKTTWVKFMETTFEVEIRYLGKAELKKLVEQCQTKKWDAKQGVEKEETDIPAYLKKFAAYVIVGWKGLTLEVIRQLLPIGETEPGQEGAEMPFSIEAAQYLMMESRPFDPWITNSSQDISLFQAKKQEQQIKN